MDTFVSPFQRGWKLWMWSQVQVRIRPGTLWWGWNFVWSKSAFSQILLSMLANLSLSSILIDLHGVVCILWSWQFVKTKLEHPSSSRIFWWFQQVVFGGFSRFLYKWNASFNPSDHRIILIPWTQKGWFFVSLCQLHGYSGTAKKASQFHLFKRCCKFRLKKMSIQFCHCLVNSKRNILFFLEFMPILPFLSMNTRNMLKRKTHANTLKPFLMNPRHGPLNKRHCADGFPCRWKLGCGWLKDKDALYHGFDVAKNGFKIIGVGKCF